MASSRNLLSTDWHHQIVAELLGSLRPFLAFNKSVRISVAYSGGLDSSVLLYALVSLRKTFAQFGNTECNAIHVHHGLSVHADAWVEHCEDQSRQWQVPLTVVHVQPSREKPSLENEARIKRHEALNRFGGDVILMAHHQDDQAETLMLNLLRGAGTLGAAGIPYQEGKIVRPFLHLPKAMLKDYAMAQGLKWVEDDSNASLLHRRNVLRHQVLPVIKQHFPAALANLAKATELFGRSQQLLDDLAREDGAEQAPLPLAVLRKLAEKNPQRALNALIYNLRQQGVRLPSRVWIEECYRQLLQAPSDRQVELKAGHLQILRYRDAVHILAETELKGVDSQGSMPWTGSGVAWGGQTIKVNHTPGQGIRAVMLDSQCEFRPRRGGERVSLRKGFHSEVKNLLREAGLPPWLRSRLPLLFHKDELIWIPGIGIAENYRCKPEEDGISLEFAGLSW